MIKTILKIIRVLLAAAAVFVCADLFYDMVSARLDLAANRAFTRRAILLTRRGSG